MDNYTDNAIFEQICEVNDLDPAIIREKAKDQDKGKASDIEQTEHLIRTAYNYKAKQVIEDLDLGSTTGHESIQEGKEYSINPDPAAPSFIINEDFIHSKYSESEAQKLIEALGKVMMPVTG